MKRRAYIILPVLLLTLAVQGCLGLRVVTGSGRIVERERPVDAFSSIALAGIGTLHIEVGDRESLHIVAERNLLPYLETTVRDGRLTLGVRDGVTLRDTVPIHYYLTVVELEAIVLSGSGTILAPDLKAGEFAAQVTGSGDLEMGELRTGTARIGVSGSGIIRMEGLRADALDVHLSGSGDLGIGEGLVDRQTIVVSGSGTYVAERLESNEAKARLSGSGEALIHVRNRLDARVSGSGDVYYVGRPAVMANVTGSGKVRSVDG
jgi:hypothetical protein